MKFFGLLTVIVLLAISAVSQNNDSNQQTELFRIWDNGKAGFIDRSGKVVIEPKFFQASGFSGGIAQVWINCYPCEIRSIDGKGKFVRGQIFDDGHQFEFREGLAAVKIGDIVEGKYGFVDNKGNFIIQPQFDYTNGFYEGLARVMIRPNEGFIDHSGKIVIPIQYDDADDFSDGLAAVKINDKFGFIDKSGNVIIQPQFDEVKSFGNGLAPVLINKKWGFINKKGEIVIKPKY